MTTRTVTPGQYARIMARMSPEIDAALVKAMRSAALRLHGMVVEEIDTADPYPAVDTGQLRGSVTVDRVPRGAHVFTDAPHAAVIEHGSRPHWPPLQPLIDWAQRKGLGEDEDEAEEIARSVQRQIAIFGTEPRHYFAKANTRLDRDGIVQEEIRAEMDGVFK